MPEFELLQVGPLSEAFNQALAACYRVTPLWQQDDPVAFLREQGTRFGLLVTSARFGCSAGQLEQLPNLKAICSFGVGHDALAVQGARERGIPVSTTPEVLNDCVADLAMGLILDTARGLSRGDRHVRAGDWGTRALPLGRKVSGKRLGIVGLGRIGQALVQRASGFQMAVRYHNRRPLVGSALTYEPALLELARWADFLVLTCPGGPATEHLIDAPVLHALGPQGILINVARGSVVDQPALIHALQHGLLGGAGLDVYASEPQVPAALRALENLVLAPHIGSATEETRGDMEHLVLANLRAFVERGQLLTPL
ncbi:MAG: 2-hydroxyacid dehydrogenase [Pseudomonas sp.]|uniref:2-hydroxyacid dehydrogenase n=1 Tax=Pseudomonas sp. TaxID=306 RepID=UPI003394B7CE